MSFLDPYITRYTVLISVLVIIAVLFHFMGVYRGYKKVTYDCLMNEATGRFTINNVARYTVLHAFLVVWVTTHYNVYIKPAFKIETIPFTTVELGLILAFIIGAELAKKYNANPRI